MRAKLLLITFVFILLVGCAQNEEDPLLPTRAQSALDGPRGIADTPTPSLPATWTPEPVQVASTPIPASSNGESETTSNNEDANNGQRTHLVQAGETLGEIASHYGVSLSELVDANDIVNVDVIEVGTLLVIPGG